MNNNALLLHIVLLQLSNERITSENKEFLQEVVKESYLPPALGLVPGVSPLKSEPIEPQVDFVPKAKRPGLIVKKIGIYPMWLKNGRKILTTLLQVKRHNNQFRANYYTIIIEFTLKIPRVFIGCR